MSSPTRRERLRTATITEIKDLARRMLVDGGPAAISLRAIARDMGMTAPAIYRYFPSLDALVAELTEDLYDELRQAVEVARDRVPEPAPLPHLLAMGRAFRRWSIEHRAEFGLMFGNPVPGVTTFEEACKAPDHAGARFGAPFLEAFTQLWAQAGYPTPPEPVLQARLAPVLGQFRLDHPDLPLPVLYAFLTAWIRLYGIVALEVFGHLQWALPSMEPLFELELDVFAAQITAPPR
ncbi:MAG TPA: TetR/AcrR family transcriptional regulator [Micromonosporaceae bacterium]